MFAAQAWVRSSSRHRHLVVGSLACSLILLAALPVAAVEGGGSRTRNVAESIRPGLANWVYDVTGYGAVADAIEASGCDVNEETPLGCRIPGSGTDNEAAFEAAVAAACADGGGVVYIPPGKYRVLYAVDVNCSNLWVVGEPGSVLLPLNGHGQDIFAVCKSTITWNACDDPDDPDVPLQTNNRISGFTIRDDAPAQHGLTTGEEVEVTNHRGGDFVYGEELDFIDGIGPTSNTATFYYLSTDRDRFIYTFETAPSNTNMCGGALAGPPYQSTGCTGTIRGRRSGAEIDIVSLTAPTVVEESHGIVNKYTDGFIVENMRFEFLGDETLNVSKHARNTVVRDNVFFHTPGLPSGGSSIDLSNGAIDTQVYDNEIIVGLGRSNKAIEIAPTSYDIHGTRITSNTIVEPNTGDRNHSVAEFGILMTPGTARAYQNEISGNRIDFDLKNWGVCSDDARRSCKRHTACLQSNATCNVSGDAAGYALRSEEAQGGTNSGNIWRHNEVVGPVAFIESGGMGPTLIERNHVSTSRDGIQYAIEVNGRSLEVRGNWFDGFGGGGLRSHSVTETLVVESNSFTRVGRDFQAWDWGEAIVRLPPNPVDSVVFSGNELLADTPIDPGAKVPGIVCAGEPGPMSIVGNWISNTDKTAIYTCSGTIDENVIIGSGNAGIWVSGLGTNNTSTTVSRNWIEAVAGIGVVLSNGIGDATVDGNECQDVGTACIAEIDGAGDVSGNLVSNNHSSDTPNAPGAGFLVGPTGEGAGGCPGDSSSYSQCVNNIADDGVNGVKPVRPVFPSFTFSVPALDRGALLVLAAGMLAFTRYSETHAISRQHGTSRQSPHRHVG